MGKIANLKNLTKAYRNGAVNRTLDESQRTFRDTLRKRTLVRMFSRAGGTTTKYVERSEGKKEPGMSRGFHRALKRAWRNNYESAQRVQKTYPGARVSSGLTRTCVYE